MKPNKNTVLDPEAKKGKKKKVKVKGKSAATAPTPMVDEVYKPTTYFSDKQIPGALGLKMGQKVMLEGTVVSRGERQDKHGVKRNFDIEIRSAIVKGRKGKGGAVKA